MDESTEDCRRWIERMDHLDSELIPLLRAIREGIHLRRTLDEKGYEGTGISAASLLRRQLELESAAYERIADQGTPAEALRDWLSAHLETALREDQDYLGQIFTRPDFDELTRAYLLERYRHDLRWASMLAAILEDSRPTPPTAMAQADLERLRRTLQSLGAVNAVRGDQLEDLLSRVQQVGEQFLGRQVAVEIAAPIPEDATAADLWSRRIRLSRLQARVESLASGAPVGSPEDRSATMMLWATRLEAQRELLARTAADRLDELDADIQHIAWEGLALAMQGEANDIITDLEELPLSESVRLLDLAHGDMDVLAQAGRTRLREHQYADFPDSSKIRNATRRISRLKRLALNEWQEKRLAQRLEGLFGRRFVTWMENTVLVLILLVTALITIEMVMEATGHLTDRQQEAFAWADLGICTLFLAEFGLKLTLVPNRFRYFRRHFLVDFLASIPFGFLAYTLTTYQVAISRSLEGIQFLRLLRFGRLTRLVRYVRLARPLIRLGRILIFALRFTDRLVRRYASLLNQNIVLFESGGADAVESRPAHLLVSLRRLYNQRVGVVQAGLDPHQKLALATRLLFDLEATPEQSGTTLSAPIGPVGSRVVPVETVVDHLIELTPEQLLEERGPVFVESIDRYIRLFDAPLIRRLPGIRAVVAYRENGPAEAVCLAANALGHVLQGGLNVVYYLADLQATISPPLFLDRLGATIIGATQRPAKRLLTLGFTFLVLFVVVYNLNFLSPARGIVDKLQALLGWPVIILGVICLAFWMLGVWFRRIANQASDFCDRVAEAQFASQTRNLKLQARDEDFRVIHERVIAPELALRAADDRVRHNTNAGAGVGRDGEPELAEAELLFLNNIQLLYDDYVQGAPLHRTDTKTTNQLLGNLALVNLRRSHLQYILTENRRLERLDLSRSTAGALGGPYLWFNYITRMIVQETAKLLVDYNRHAIPCDRLSCSPDRLRRRYREWLANRLGIDPDSVRIPDRQGSFEEEKPAEGGRRPGLDDSFENVEFTAIDFLGQDPVREQLIQKRYGDQVLELLHKDRRRIIRRTFRSYPLHTLPRTRRTINLYTLYKDYLSGGRVLALPLVLAWRGLRLSVTLIRNLIRIIREILHPQVVQEIEADRPEPFQVALRKIHRMRKPAFMESLRLRAAFDIEYLGLPLPTAPSTLGPASLLERDLDFIGASRRDRILAEQLDRRQAERLMRVSAWLDRFDWTFPRIIDSLERDFPFLSDRAGESLRALVTACLIDYDDIYSLATSIDALRALMIHGANPAQDSRRLPTGLPDPLLDLRQLWRPVSRRHPPWTSLFDLPCFPNFDAHERRRILRYLKRHSRVTRGWIRVVLTQGGEDPWETVRSRLKSVLLRTDLWSDQIIILRAVQTLTILDIHHYCELVTKLGGYQQKEDLSSIRSGFGESSDNRSFSSEPVS